MDKRFIKTLVTGLFVSYLVVLMSGLQLVNAQGEQPTSPTPVILPEITSVEEYQSALAALPQNAAALSAIQPASIAGYDNFGYGVFSSNTDPTKVEYNWINAYAQVGVGQPGCQKISISGTDAYAQVIFTGGKIFPFYENNYSSVFVNTEGYLAMDTGSARFENTPLPLRAFPNNLISVFWDDLSINTTRYPQSGIYVCQTDDYIVLEWHQAVLYQAEDQGTATFEAILYWNGDIIVQYNNFYGDTANATTGIEDSRGIDGLQYQYNDGSKVGPGLAILFKRPVEMARTYVWPEYQGKFAAYTDAYTYSPVDFTVNVVNTGDLSGSTFDIYTVSATGSAADWDILLPDLPANREITIDQAKTGTFTVRAMIPDTASVGAVNKIQVKVQSLNDSSKIAYTYLQVSVPAPFVQSFWENDHDQLIFDMIERSRSQQDTILQDVANTGDLAVVRRPIGYAYFWDVKRASTNGGYEVNEIFFTLLNLSGQLQSGGVHKLADLGNPSQHIRDTSMAVAVAPDGRIGVFWLRETGSSLNTLVENLYFSILDSSGQFVMTSQILPLTTNTISGALTYRNLNLTATTDSRFVLAWREQIHDPSGVKNSIMYEVIGSSGNVMMEPLRYRAGTFDGSDLYFSPALAGLSNNRFIMAWGRKVNNAYKTEYAIFNSRGQPLQQPRSINGLENGAGPDIVQLLNGRVALAIPYAQVYMVMLEYSNQMGVYQQVGYPTEYTSPACKTGDERYVSLAATQDNQAVLTWTCYSLVADQNKDGISPYQSELYYALVGTDGSAVTPPQILYSSPDAQDPLIHTNQQGYASSTHPKLKVGVVDLVLDAPPQFQVNQDTTLEVPAFYLNVGKLTATNVTVTAQLPTGLEVVDYGPKPAQVIGNQITWNISSVSFLDSGQVYVKVKSDQQGLYTIHWVVDSTESDDAEIDNAGDTLIKVEQFIPYIPGGTVYLPLVRR